MLTKEKILSILMKEYSFLNTTYGVKRIGLFGSFVHGVANENSDIDLIIEFEHPIGMKFIELCDFLEELFNRKVDVLTAEGLENIRVKQVYDSILKSISYVPAA